ncbi:MAG TPA: hypothetical protein VHO02_03170 [Fibrobacteria bacterium]|nr:hypothetical protein [Fibrobacteria bacterium]
MLSQIFKSQVKAIEPETRILVGSWAIGSTGAVGTKTGGSGMTLTRNSAGNYTVQLTGVRGVSAGVPAFLHCQATLYVNDVDASNDTDSHVIWMLSKSASAGTASFMCVDEGGVSREAPSGATISVFAVVKLSGVTR